MPSRRRNRSDPRRAAGEPGTTDGGRAPIAGPGLPQAWEWPLLAALVLGPVGAGGIETAPAGGVACLVWLAFFLRILRPSGADAALRLSTPGWLLAGFVLIATLSVTGSVYRGASLFSASQYAAWFAAFLLAADLVRRPGGPARLVGAILAGGTVAALIGVQETITNGRVGDWHWRVFGPFVNPNVYAACLLLMLPLALAVALRSTGPGTALAGLLALLFTSQLLSTGSRAAVYFVLPGMLGLFMGFAWMAGFLRDRVVLVRLAVIGLMAVPVVRVSATPLQHRSVTVRVAPAPGLLCPPEEVGGTEDSTEFRKLTWMGTARMAAARPLLGFGAGSFEYVYPRYGIAGFTRRAHQSYLQFAAELGLPALLLWIAALGVVAAQLLRAARGAGSEWWLPGIAAALGGAAAHNLVDYSWYVAGTALPFWALLGLAGARSGEAWGGGVMRVRQPPALRSPWLWLAVPYAAITLLSGAAGHLDRAATQATAERRTGEAREAWEAAAALAPWAAEPRAGLASLHARSGNHSAAVREYAAALARSPTHSPAHYRLGRARAAGGDWEGAQRAYRAGLEQAPNSGELLLHLAMATDRSGDRPGAVALYRRLVEIEPTPYARVRAIGETRDFRYAVAHHELGRDALSRGDLATTRREYLAAACSLSRIRKLIDALPVYLDVTGLRDPILRQELRHREQELWRWLAGDFRRLSDRARGDAAWRMAEEVQAAKDPFEAS